MKKMRFSFWIVVLFLFSGGVADAVDWTGLWVTQRWNEWTVSQNGQQIDAVVTKATEAYIAVGYKIGDKIFYGTLDGQTLTGKTLTFFPSDCKKYCTECSGYFDFVLTISSDGNIIHLEQTLPIIYYNDCSISEGSGPSYGGDLFRKDYGNVTGDDRVDLSDAILALRIVAGISVTDKINLYAAEVNGDKKIGIEEVVYILQKASGLRP